MKNIELKLQVKDFNKIIALLKLNKARFAGALKQIDTYYNCLNGRLKIREINNKNFELIFYKRANKKGSKISNYYVLPVNKVQVQILKHILKSAYGEIVIIKKVRNLWIYKHTRIHLDKVYNLGSFVELETVVRNIKIIQAKQEHQVVIKKLNLFKYKKIEESYSDLLKLR